MFGFCRHSGCPSADLFYLSRRSTRAGNETGKAPAANSQMKSFQFTVFAAENGYRVRVKYGEEEYVWPEVYKTLEQAGIEILKALTTASQSRGEELSEG